MSIWHPQIPLAVPVILKSMSPKASSSPKISVKIAALSPTLIRPMAIPEIGAVILTPASMRAMDETQTEAIEVDPLDSKISETILTV